MKDPNQSFQADVMRENLRFRAQPGHDMDEGHPKAPAPSPKHNRSVDSSEANSSREAVMSFSLVKINDRGKRQNRLRRVNISY